jgi:hypothetical protein
MGSYGWSRVGGGAEPPSPIIWRWISDGGFEAKKRMFSGQVMAARRRIEESW